MFPDKWTQCCKINVFKRMEQLLLAAPAVASQKNAALQTYWPVTVITAPCGIWPVFLCGEHYA